MESEPILKENPLRFVFFPIQHQDIYDMYKKHMHSFWIVDEIDFYGDLEHWNKKLNEDERTFFKYVLAFFASSDGIVSENLAMKFFSDIQIPEARFFYGFQIMMENIHAETYSRMIDVYVDNMDEKFRLFNAISEIPVIKKKAEWALKWINDDAPFSKRLVAFAAVEGIFFSSSFCSIFWLKKKGLMPGLTFSNELISRDEGLHTDFACLLYSKLNNKLSQEEIYEIIDEATNLEVEFITEALQVDIIGINSKSMTKYIQFIADRLLYTLGYQKKYNASNPFEWMNMISLQGKSNFFEKRVGEYSKYVQGKNKKINLDEDF